MDQLTRITRRHKEELFLLYPIVNLSSNNVILKEIKQKKVQFFMPVTIPYLSPCNSCHANSGKTREDRI